MINNEIELIKDTLTYVNKFHGTTVLIKLGGSILHEEALINSLCDDLKLLRGAGIKIVLVHGGSKAINETLEINQIESNFLNGLRVTSKETMKIIEMVLCGHVNSILVRKLNSIGINARGLKGTDSKMLFCDYYSHDHGYVGTITTVNVEPINAILSLQTLDFGAIPVIAPIGVDKDGNALNINADWAASAIACALNVDKLIFLTDQNGIYNQNKEIISEISAQGLQQLIQNETVKEGMLTKTRAIINALQKGMNNIHIINGKEKHSMIRELFTINGVGTLCKKIMRLNAMKLQTKHLLKGNELTGTEIENLLSLAISIKNNKSAYADSLAGKQIALLFEKPSLRTRFSFTVAINELGGHSIESVSQTRKVEDPKDLMRVLQGYCHGMMIRTFSDRYLDSMATVAKIPIINGLTDMFHPCQTLADLLTLRESFPHEPQIRICYLGDGNNILHSLLLMAPKVGIHVNYCCPEGHGPDKKVLAMLESNHNPYLVNAFSQPQEAVTGCHAVYTDVWTSMGFDAKDESIFEGYQVNEALMSYAAGNAVFMHCMPMNRGKEVSESLPDTACSVIFQQSENRLYVQKALLVALLNNVVA